MVRKRKQQQGVVSALSLTRLAIGSALLVAPRRSLRVWTGEEAGRAGRVPAVALGARELALGVGTLTALAQRGSVRGWVRAGVVCDASDALITILFCRGHTPLRRALWAVAPTLAAVAGRRSAASLK